MNTIEIIMSIYKALLDRLDNGVIPIHLRPKEIVGTVQDDHFDMWVG